jgi:hypothetical protein
LKDETQSRAVKPIFHVKFLENPGHFPVRPVFSQALASVRQQEGGTLDNGYSLPAGRSVPIHSFLAGKQFPDFHRIFVCARPDFAEK